MKMQLIKISDVIGFVWRMGNGILKQNSMKFQCADMVENLWPMIAIIWLSTH